MPSDAMKTEDSPEPVAWEPVEIDGVLVGRVLRPVSAEEVASLLAEAHHLGHGVVPFGGGTALRLGNVPERVDLALSTAGLNQILDYEPMDLVVSVGAGMRFADLQATLGEHGQGIPLDAPGYSDATVGGLVATALAGSRRLAHGTLRDLLIGMQCAHPSGTVTKSGGMVVKNVTGYDLPRLMHGSLGTLGVITSVNLKVLPLPRTEATVILPLKAATEAETIQHELRGAGLRPSAADLGFSEGRWWVAVRLEGREGGVNRGVETLRRLATSGAEVLRDAESADWWRNWTDRHAPSSAGKGEVLLRAAMRPKETIRLVKGLAQVLDGANAELVEVDAMLGVGLVTLRIRLEQEGPFRQIWQRLLTTADQVTILAAPPEWKAGIDVWGNAPDGLAVMRALKAEFDPGRVLNPGRFVAGI